MSQGGVSVAIVGAGMGGLAAAIRLAAGGHRVTVFERADEPGGKVGRVEVDGCVVDTGPTVLTMRGVLEDLFEAAGTRLGDHLTLLQHSPEFRYHYDDGTRLDVGPDNGATVERIRQTLGVEAAGQFGDFMDYSRSIWEAAAPNFIFSEAPSIGSMFKLGLRQMSALRDIDPMTTMWKAITSRVDSPHLRKLLARYATYNGSDPRQAPATLNCISWVELGMGSWGIEGGMFKLPEALEQVARSLGVSFRFGADVTSLRRGADGWVLRTSDGGEPFGADCVVANSDVSHLTDDLLGPGQADRAPESGPSSMSGWNGVVRVRRRPRSERPPHQVVFPADYMAEFEDIFDRGEVPSDPTVYACAPEKAYGRDGWDDREPLFVMANAPPIDGELGNDAATWSRLKRRALERLTDADVIDEGEAVEASVVWERTPVDLARRFPGSDGAIYGASSNSKMAAFNRPPNRVERLEGLYLAGGSAHPGGGVPMCLQSGRLAAEALLEDQ
jgi:1-hydroxycarotenoid 3,4-desaturase